MQCIANNKLRCVSSICPLEDRLFLDDIEFYLCDAPLKSPSIKPSLGLSNKPGRLLKRTVVGTLLPVSWWERDKLPLYLDTGRMEMTHALCRQLRKGYFKWASKEGMAPVGHRIKKRSPG